jgi:acyl phosphate:glycerol-3-phosphate acyltransferase
LNKHILFLIVTSYILGSIPTGVLVSKMFRLSDPRTTGSGNIGATNVLRLGGKTAGLLTLLGDFAKGMLAVDLARLFIEPGPGLWVCAVAAVLGHMFSIFLKLRGGKGVATGYGVLTPIYPFIVLGLLAIWLVTAFLTRYSSLAALVSFAGLPVILALTQENPRSIVFGGGLALIIILRHHDNIRRLIARTESKIGGKNDASL